MASHHEENTPPERHACHCSHVVVLVHEHRKINWEDLSHGLRDLKRINWVLGLIFVFCLGTFGHELWGAMRSHIREDAPTGRSGERMGADHVPHPEEP